MAQRIKAYHGAVGRDDNDALVICYDMLCNVR